MRGPQCERGKSGASMGKFREQDKGVVIECDGGYFAGDASGGAFFDRQERRSGSRAR